MSTCPSSLVIPMLIVGLGNPGSKYDRTRHNIGFDVIDQLAQKWQISLAEQRRFQGLVGDGVALPGHRIRLLKPQTYMNKSGQSIRAVLDWFKLSPQSVLLVYDDMDLPIGKIRLRLSGSAGGHNGMKSTISHLGTQDFPRLRIGISSPQASGPSKDTIAHVLGRFTPQELKVLPTVLGEVVAAVEMSLTQGVEKTMSLYNGLDLATS
jgi:peptidyl-tRNA hydrolase, PTH1 family